MSDSSSGPQIDEARLQQLSLTAWEMETRGNDTVLDDRSRAMVMRSHEKLQSELEKVGDITPEMRSQIRIREESRSAVLLIHGSTGSPVDLRGLSDYLFERGFTVCNMLLPGHGLNNDKQPEVKWKACLSEVEIRFGILKRAYDKVHVVGFSFGGSLAIHLGPRQNPASLTLLSAALNPRVPFFTRLMINLKLHHLPFIRRRIGWDIEVFDCMDKAKSQLNKVGAPIYAAHCQDDDRIDPSSLRTIQKKAKHRSSRFRLFQEGGHMILEAHGRESLNRDIEEFISSR